MAVQQGHFDTIKNNAGQVLTIDETISVSGKISHALATAENDVLVGAPTPFGSWVKKTLAEFKTILGLIASSIVDGDTTHAPDGNSVFDALALKAPLASPVFTGNVTLSGNVLNSSLPAFLAQPAASLDNVTGDGTEYTVVWGTEIYDQGSNFDGTSTFTAPATGRYHFDIQVDLFGLDSGHTTHELKLVTSNRTIGFLDTFTTCPFINCHKLSISQDVDMDAGDTAVVKVAINGVNKTVDVNNVRSFFSGHLVC